MHKYFSLSKKRYKRKKILIVLLCVVGMLILLPLGLNACVIAQGAGAMRAPEEAAGFEADCILILGAGVWDGNRPSSMLEDRLLQGIALYNLGVSDRLLMSGDHGQEDYDEVNVMKRFAIDAGVPSEKIFMDHAGFSTYESLYRARDIFQAKKVVIVTQKYHLYRALYIAERLGLEAIGVPSDPRTYKGQFYRDVREVFARIKDVLYILVGSQPAYLGDVIPVWGDGDVTND